MTANPFRKDAPKRRARHGAVSVSAASKLRPSVSAGKSRVAAPVSGVRAAAGAINPKAAAVAALALAAAFALCAFAWCGRAAEPEGSSTRVYEYRIQAADGQMFTVRETAAFGDDGCLEQSNISITVPDAETGQAILSQMEASFGDRLVMGDAAADTVMAVVKPTSDNIDAATYDDLMRKAVSS